MACDLVERAKSEKLTADEIGDQTEILERIFDSDHCSVLVVECRDCRQIFIQCYSECTSPDWENDQWTFWVPVNLDVVADLKKAQELKFVGELVTESGTICWHPVGYIFWTGHAFPLALLLFM